jgi:hypothetical protein
MTDSTAKDSTSPRPKAAVKPTSPKPPAVRAKVSAAKPGTPVMAPPAPSTDGSGALAADALARPETFQLRRGGIDQATADEINVTMGGIGRADASDIAVSIGGVGMARAEKVSVEMGAIGLAVAGDARVSQGFARFMLAREARVEQGLIGTLITGRATIHRTTGVFLLVAGRVDGPVKAVLDWRGGLAFGAAFGLFWAMLRRR